MNLDESNNKSCWINNRTIHKEHATNINYNSFIVELSTCIKYKKPMD